MTSKILSIGNVTLGNNKPFVLIAGPCVMESRSHALEMSQAIKEITDKLDIPFIYKTSFDKANRTSFQGQRGMGMIDSLPVLGEIHQKLGCPVITDVHAPDQCAPVAEVVNILQIPAFLCRQTDLLQAAAATGKAVNVNKGQFLAPWDMANVVKKLESFGAHQIMVCERGACFGYNTLVSDMRSLPIMARSGYPVVFDATHSVQKPGGEGASTGGEREFVSVLARAAVAVGVAAVFIETHQDPDNAPSDGPNMVHLKQLPQLLQELKAFDRLSKAHPLMLEQKAQ